MEDDADASTDVRDVLGLDGVIIEAADDDFAG